MKIPSDSSANINSTRSGVLRALGLRPGQSFTAQVLSNSPDGLTQLKVSSQQISLSLPSKPQLGVMLKFLFQSGGEKPQITLMGEVTSNSKTIQPAQPSQATQNNATKITISTQQANPQATASQNNNQQTTTPQTSNPQNTTPQNQTAQSSTQSQASSIPNPAPNPMPNQTTNVPLPPATQAKLQLLAGQTVNAKVSGQTANGQTNFSIGTTQFSAPIANNPPIGAVLQFLVKSENGQARLVLSEPNINLAQQAQAKPTTQNPYTNQAIKNTIASSTSQNSQQNQTIPLPIANPLAQAISSAIPLALAQQDSLTALFANLMGLQKQNAKLEPNVKKAVQQLLDGQLKLDGKALNGNAIKQAISRSGNFLESTLSGKAQSFTTPPAPTSPAQQISLAQSDMKALLLSLRSSLVKWLGEPSTTQKFQESQAPPPPRKGISPRAAPPNSQRLPEGLDAKNIGNALLRQTDSALSRLRLFQISSLPDQLGRSAMSNELNLELLFSLGNESNIIRFQIEREGGNKNENGEQNWNLRFAMNLQSLGEVGANISFRLGKVGAMIWAQEEETAKQLNDMLPELTSSLAARSLETNFIRVRHGAPEKGGSAKGDFVNDLL